MSLWTTLGFRSRPQDGRRASGRSTRPRPTIRLALEALEARNAPGSLSGVSGPAPVTLLGNGSPSPAATTRTNATVSNQPTTPSTPASVNATRTGGTAALPPSLAANTASSSAGDPFVDESTAPAGDRTSAAPPVTSTGADNSPTTNVLSVAPPVIGGVASPPAQTANAAMPNTALPDAALSTGSPPSVTLKAPDFVNYRGSPLLVVQATPAANDTLNPTVSIDIDLKHDRSFNDAGDQNVATGQLGLNNTAAITLTTPLAKGTYLVRARVADAQGNVGMSAIESMTVNPNSGFDGSQPLLDLAYGVPYGTPIPQAGSGGGGENGPGAGGLVAGAPNPKGFKFLEFDKQNRVLINVHSTETSNLAGLQSDLTTQLGFTTTELSPDQNRVTGWLPVNHILNLPNLPNFDSVTPVYKPITNVGSYPTDADPIIHSDTFRTTNNVDGTGVKVGVISDSANEVGGGLAASLATGDIAPNVQVLADNPLANDPMPTDEGRAMLEIVHHVAPGASEAFNTANGSGASGIADAINALAGAGAKVITDDVTGFDEPMFNDGLAAQAATNAVKQGVFYTSSAGNNADHGYLAAFKPVTATVGGVTGTFQDITGAGDPLQTFTLGLGQTLRLSLDYDSAFLEGGGTGNFAVPNDVQVLVTDATGKAFAAPLVFNSQGTNINEAFQFVAFTNDGSFGTTNFSMSFNVVSGANPTMLRWVAFDDGNPGADPMALGEGAPTTFGHADAPGVVAAGAVNYQTSTVVEPFSARGDNIPILFDITGVRLATPVIRNEPIVAAPDNVQTSFFAVQDNTGAFRFQGTSAATPHVAAAAALLLQQAPTATPADVTQYLVKNALSLNDPTHAGAGLIQLTVPLVIATPATVPATNFSGVNNQTSDTALYLGMLFAGQPADLSNLQLAPLADGRNDYDWFSFTAGQAGSFVATEGTTAGGNVELELFTLQHGTLVELAESVTQSISSQSLGVAVAAGQEILVEVKGQNTSFGVQDSASYQLSATIS